MLHVFTYYFNLVERVGFEPTYSKRADLQSAGINHSPISPCNLVPGAGLEPACLSTGDFKSPVYTISPPGQLTNLAYPQGLEPRPTVLETVMLPLH